MLLTTALKNYIKLPNTFGIKKVLIWLKIMNSYFVITTQVYLCLVLTPRFSGSGLCPCGRGGVLSL